MAANQRGQFRRSKCLSTWRPIELRLDQSPPPPTFPSAVGGESLQIFVSAIRFGGLCQPLHKASNFLPADLTARAVPAQMPPLHPIPYGLRGNTQQPGRLPQTVIPTPVALQFCQNCRGSLANLPRAGSAFPRQACSHSYFFRSSAMVANCSRAASRSSVISWAMISSAGRFADSSSASSFSQKMSRFTLSRLRRSS